MPSLDRAELARTGSKVLRWTGWRIVGRGLIVLALLGTIVAHSVEDWHVRIDETTLGLFLLLVLVLIGLDRIEEIGGPGGFKAKFRQLHEAAEAASAVTDPEERADLEPLSGSTADQLLQVAWELRNDLAYIRDVLLGPDLMPPGAKATLTAAP
jgi:hypothetical protein